MRQVLAVAATVIFAGCGSSDDTMTMPDLNAPDLVVPCDGSTLSLTLDLRRNKPGSTFDVLLHAARCDAATGLAIDLKVSGGTATPVADKGNGDYSATVTAAALSGEVTVQASAGGTTVTRTAIVLPSVSQTWDQPEAIAGLVNTPGWEDSAMVSPDGAWLIVGTYSPVDLFCCLTATCGGTPADPKSTFCQTSLGPYMAPERPNLRGANRITDATHIVNNCPSLGVPPNGGEANVALPPVAAYLFHHQPDGSFAEPSFIGFDADGCVGPFGFSFADYPNDTGSHLVFAFNDPRDNAMGDTQNHIYWTPIAFSSENSLATYQWSMMSGVTTNVFVPIKLPLAAMPPGEGNPSFWGSRLWFDDEALAERDSYFADATGNLPSATFSAPKSVGVSLPGKAETQPFIDDTRLYFTRDGNIVAANLLAAAKDPSLVDSWSASDVELAPEPTMRAGAIVSVGQASIARDNDGQWLYFVYVLATPNGLDANVGRVRFR